MLFQFLGSGVELGIHTGSLDQGVELGKHVGSSGFDAGLLRTRTRLTSLPVLAGEQMISILE